MAIRKYTKKRRRRSLRKLRGGTVTIDRVNVRKAERIAPDELFTRRVGSTSERRPTAAESASHSENARCPAPRTPRHDGERERGSF